MSLIIALVGAESTGKTTLAKSLASRLAELTGLRCTSVDEHLRRWCDEHGRTPRAGEQATIAEHQAADIEAAAAAFDLVVADTTPLMTAVYSLMLFGDPSLVPRAIEVQRRCAITLLTALDLPWVSDGLQRDGAQVRAPVDALLRQLMLEHRLPWSVVGGAGAARLAQALDAVAPVLRQAGLGGGFFTRLQSRNTEASTGGWSCALCDDGGDCEHAARRRG